MNIKIIERPRVYLMGGMADIHSDQNYAGHQEFESRNAVTYASRPDDEHGHEWGEELVEYAGRLCYMSFHKRRPGGNKAYINHLLEAQHGSCLEHAVYSFIITGVSRSLTHELIRHRAGWAYSELSQRYVDLSDVSFVIPPALAGNEELTRHFTNGCLESMLSYRAIVDEMAKQFPKISRKEIRQSARSVLPNCTETKIAATANARALRHFFEMRGSIHADVEIARLAVVMCKMMREYAPNIFGDYDIITVDGREVIETKYRKV